MEKEKQIEEMAELIDELNRDVSGIRLSIGEASRTSRKTHSNGPPGRYR